MMEVGYLVSTPTKKKTKVFGEDYYSTILVTDVKVGSTVKIKTNSIRYVVYFDKNLSKEQLSCLMKDNLIVVFGVFGTNTYYNNKYEKISYNYIRVLSFYHIRKRSEIIKEQYEMLKENELI